MKSLTDLNSKAENDLQEFSDERTGKIIWDRTQYDTVFDVVQDENEYIGLNIPLRLTEIVNYQQTQLKLEIDLSDTTGEVQFEYDFPSWATVDVVGRVYTISGFRHINDFNELYDLNQRFRLAGYFGNTDTISIRFHYLVQSTPAERPWTLDLDITEVLNMTSPPASQLYGIQMVTDSLVSITPPIVSDPGNIGVDFRMEIAASETGVLQTISIPQTSGATTVINSSDKTVLIEGTVAQINTELAGLQVRFGEVEVDFDLVFELTDVFEDSSAGLVSDLKVTRFTSITTDLEIFRQYIYDDSLSNPDLEKPFRDGRFAINADSGVTLTISVPNNAFRYLSNISPEIYSLDTTSVTLSGLQPSDLELIVAGLRYIAPQTYAGAVEWDFTIIVDGVTLLDAYRYDMAGNYVVWDSIGTVVGASFTANITEGDEVNSTDYPNFVWGGGGSGTIDIAAINNPAEANIVITWDLAHSDTIPNYGSTLDWELHWDNIPAGVSVTKTTNNKYRVVGIDSVSDWDAMKHPTRATMPNDASGDFSILGTITYTPDRTKTMTMRFNVTEEREFGIVADWWRTTDGENRSGQYGYSVSFLNYTRGYTGGELPTVTVVDIGQDNPTYTVTITPDKPNSVDDINAGGTLGGSVLFNDGSKSLTIIGSKAQVNDHLANITIDMSINSMEHGYLRYAVQNNVNSETDECAVYLGAGQYDPVFSFDCSDLSPSGINQPWTSPITFDTADMTPAIAPPTNDPQPGDSLVLSLYNTTFLTSVELDLEIFFDDLKGFSSTYSSANSLYDVHPFRHPVTWTFNIIAANAYEYIQSHNGDNTYHYIAPYDQSAFIREFQPHGEFSSGNIRVDQKRVEDIESFGRVDDTHRIFHQTNYYPKNFYSTTENDYVGYGFQSGNTTQYEDPNNGVKYGVAEDGYAVTQPDGNGWIIRHEPEHYGHCISANSDTSRIAISHAGEVYTGGIYGDRYFYGLEYSGIPGLIGSTLLGTFGTEWGDFGSIGLDSQRDALGQSNYVEQFSNDYRATHTGVVYIYDDSTDYYTDTNGVKYATPIQKIYPPVSDSSGDPIAAAGNHLLFGEYSAMSLDGNRLAITCPGWQSGNVDGVSLKGVYTYTFNNVTSEYDLDAVLNNTALINPEWDNTGNILVGQDRDDITKLRIYSRNSNGSLSLLESLPITSTYVNNWDFSPVSRTIVISNADGTIDVYEINNSTLDYSKTQEFSKGASESRGEVQISTDGLMIVWKVNGFSNSDDSANDWSGYGQFVIYRSSITDQFSSALNNTISGTTVINGVEHTNSLDIAGYTSNVNRSYYPYTNVTDHQSYYGAVFPLGNRWTWSAIFAPPNAGTNLTGNTATIVWQPSDDVTEYGTNSTVKFNVDRAGMGDYEFLEVKLVWTPADSSVSVTRNIKYYNSVPFPYTDITYIPFYDFGLVYGEGDTPAWSQGYLSGGTPGNI